MIHNYAQDTFLMRLQKKIEKVKIEKVKIEKVKLKKLCDGAKCKYQQLISDQSFTSKMKPP